MVKRTKEAPAPLPPVVRVKVNPPKDTDSAGMTALADSCIKGGTDFPTTIGISPFLPAMTTENAAVKLQMPNAKDGGVSANATLLTLTRTLKGSIMGHGAWLNSQMLNMTAAAASAYSVNAGLTTAKTPGHHDLVVADTVKNGPAGSLLLTAWFISAPGRVLSCVEYSTDGQKTWSRGTDTEVNHVNLPLVFTVGQAVAVRTRRFMRGTGYTPWLIFEMTAV